METKYDFEDEVNKIQAELRLAGFIDDENEEKLKDVMQKIEKALCKAYAVGADIIHNHAMECLDKSRNKIKKMFS